MQSNRKITNRNSSVKYNEIILSNLPLNTLTNIYKNADEESRSVIREIMASEFLQWRLIQYNVKQLKSIHKSKSEVNGILLIETIRRNLEKFNK